MRGFAFLIAAIAFFAYAVTHLGDSPAPAKPTTFAELQPPKVVTPPVRATLQTEAPRAARAPNPIDISPQAKNNAPATPAAAPAPSPSPKPASAKPTTEVVLTAAAIAALIVAASRNAYYATGRPCACPDDRMRNGRSCGSRSAYSRPGGASPLCYPTDVSETMIKSYRSRMAKR